jgi:hypothetical protein
VEAATGDQVARVARRLRDLDDTAKTAASEDAARAFGDLDA